MKTLLILVSLLIISQSIMNVDAQVTYVNKACVGIDNGSVTSNLSTLLINLSFQASIVRFYNVTVGDPPYHGLFKCRDDLSVENCYRCVGDATSTITKVCPLYAEAIVWYQECMLRYANRPIFSTYETSPSYIEWNASNKVTNHDQFSPLLASAIDTLINFTAASTPLHCAASENFLPPGNKLYCFAQCTTDIDNAGCNACLRKAFSLVTNCCNAIIRAMVFLPSCQLRYDNTSFWSGSIPLAPPINQALNDKSRSNSSKTTIIVAVSSSALVGLVLLVVGLWLCKCKKQRQQSLRRVRLGIQEGKQDGIEDDIKNLESLQFDFKRIKAATSNFSKHNKLGQGGFGEVYKGKLSNGEEIAVKRLSKNSEQGTSEFQNEVILVAKLQHRNLVKLLGFCIAGKEKILVYEFLPNLSLDRFLFDPSKRATLEWEVRFGIITGVARGLLYLHEDSRLKIIHRDLKASNILLDEGMNAKIADFGLAKLFELDQTQGDTRRIAGTFGYMAPEYAMAGQFSVKSDVFSFGVIVLEIVSGQRHGFFNQQPGEGLLQRAWKLWKDEATMKLVDPLIGNFNEDEVKLCVLIALLCIQEDAAQRPRMTLVVGVLNGQSVTLPLPNAPHFFTISALNDATTSGKDGAQPRMLDHNNEVHTGPMSITKELDPR